MRTYPSGGSSWLRCYRPSPLARVRLICLPHAGGAATFYRRWPAHLPEQVELHAVQYPGREDRFADACVTDLNRLADHITGALTPLLDRPLVLFGHSMGAAVAHEVALRLHRRGSPPAHLFVSALPAPEHHQPGTLHREDDSALVAELRRLGGTDDAALEDPELSALVLPAVRADYRAFETYRPGPALRLPCPITACLGESDDTATAEQMRDWSAHTEAAFTLWSYPGQHFYLTGQEDQVAARVARTVTAWADLP